MYNRTPAQIDVNLLSYKMRKIDEEANWTNTVSS